MCIAATVEDIQQDERCRRCRVARSLTAALNARSREDGVVISHFEADHSGPAGRADGRGWPRRLAGAAAGMVDKLTARIRRREVGQCGRPGNGQPSPVYPSKTSAKDQLSVASVDKSNIGSAQANDRL